MIKRFVIGLLAVASFQFASAQSDDFGYELSVAGETKLYRGLKLEIEGSMRTQDDAERIVDRERHAEETAQAVIQGGGVGDHEDEDDNGGGDLQGRRGEALAEEVRHGCAGEALGHDPGAPAEDHPRQQGSDDGVTDTYPGAG